MRRWSKRNTPPGWKWPKFCSENVPQTPPLATYQVKQPTEYQIACIFGWWRTIGPKVSLKYLGMWFHNKISMAKSSEHITGPSIASAQQMRQFVREHALRVRPHGTVLVGKNIPGTSWHYATWVWGTAC
eukprot:scaffold260092_cov19-Tisochrysis_lutea.AAC.1